MYSDSQDQIMFGYELWMHIVVLMLVSFLLARIFAVNMMQERFVLCYYLRLNIKIAGSTMAKVASGLLV